jgi:hypothetical protein
MDDVEILTATLNSTLQRYGRLVQNYEIEIANMTAEILRLKASSEDTTSKKEDSK